MKSSDFKEFRNIGLTAYEIMVLQALRQRNDMRLSEISKLSDVPLSKTNSVLNLLREKNIITKMPQHSKKKLTEKQKKEIMSAIEKSIEFGFNIRFNGYRKLRMVWHLNGNLEKYIDGFIAHEISKMGELKKRLV